MSDLLPPSSVDLERRLASVLADAEAISLPIRDLADPDRCPLQFLPWLAWAMSVDEWSDDWAEFRKRQAVRESILLHRRKGTVWAIKRVVYQMGFAVERIQEGIGFAKWDGTYKWDGSVKWGSLAAWPLYRIYIVNRPVSNREGDLMRYLLLQVAPARCRLESFDFTDAPLKWNGSAKWDGSYKWGAYA